MRENVDRKYQIVGNARRLVCESIRELRIAIGSGKREAGNYELDRTGYSERFFWRDRMILSASEEEVFETRRVTRGNKSNAFLFLSRGDMPYTRDLFVPNRPILLCGLKLHFTFQLSPCAFSNSANNYYGIKTQCDSTYT